jgi:hypothetical protein
MKNGSSNRAIFFLTGCLSTPEKGAGAKAGVRRSSQGRNCSSNRANIFLTQALSTPEKGAGAKAEVRRHPWGKVFARLWLLISKSFVLGVIGVK